MRSHVSSARCLSCGGASWIEAPDSQLRCSACETPRTIPQAHLHSSLGRVALDMDAQARKWQETQRRDNPWLSRWVLKLSPVEPRDAVRCCLALNILLLPWIYLGLGATALLYHAQQPLFWLGGLAILLFFLPFLALVFPSLVWTPLLWITGWTARFRARSSTPPREPQQIETQCPSCGAPQSIEFRLMTSSPTCEHCATTLFASTSDTMARFFEDKRRWMDQLAQFCARRRNTVMMMSLAFGAASLPSRYLLKSFYSIIVAKLSLILLTGPAASIYCVSLGEYGWGALSGLGWLLSWTMAYLLLGPSISDLWRELELGRNGLFGRFRWSRIGQFAGGRTGLVRTAAWLDLYWRGPQMIRWLIGSSDRRVETQQNLGYSVLRTIEFEAPRRSLVMGARPWPGLRFEDSRNGILIAVAAEIPVAWAPDDAEPRRLVEQLESNIGDSAPDAIADLRTYEAQGWQIRFHMGGVVAYRRESGYAEDRALGDQKLIDMLVQHLAQIGLRPVFGDAAA